MGPGAIDSTSYAAVAERLSTALADLASACAARGDDTVPVAARGLADRLMDQRFNVVVLGEFKRGKSTFVNALLGAEVLPSAVVPLTSVVTAVTWGEETTAEVTFVDGRHERVPIGELRRFVTERDNPGNRLGVERSLVRHPSEHLRDGVFLVDTPGVGSVYGHNTDAAYRFIPEADVAIFVTSADPPISANERAFLEDVRTEAAKMFFVLNKIDYLSEPDRDASIAFTERVLSDTLGRAVPVFPVSALGALRSKSAGDERALEASGLPAFERAFRSFLLREKGVTILSSVARSGRRLVADERNSLAVEERAARLPLVELDRVAARMEDVFRDTQRSRDDMRVLLRREVERLVAAVEADLDGFRRQETPALVAMAERLLADADDVRAAAAGVDEQVKAWLRQLVDRWMAEEERRVAERYRAGTARFVEEANELSARTVELCSKILGVDLAGAEAPAGLASETRFTYSFFEVPTILGSILPDAARVLPAEMVRARALRRVRDRTPELVDKHCGRLRWDFVQRLEASRLALERMLNERIEATVASLRLGLQRARDDRTRSEGDLAAATASGAALRERLEAVDDALRRVLGAVEVEQQAGGRVGGG